ncbi:MAG: hypothetical protein ABI591_23885 [Kofleriaceae bacterium]
MSKQMELRHLARDVKTSLALALAALAPSDLIDRLAIGAGLLDAIVADAAARGCSGPRAAELALEIVQLTNEHMWGKKIATVRDFSWTRCRRRT